MGGPSVPAYSQAHSSLPLQNRCERERGSDSELFSRFPPLFRLKDFETPISEKVFFHSFIELLVFTLNSKLGFKTFRKGQGF